ncbi:hypothetical protein [Nostoc sp. CHAB 5715]|uniref:hypothetical protein n=1 Tax=Nostoc sp. CHAB 5715 TaxID=2780400 RepID=UPI001E58A037|nr:hypothetical protein [Nostoc sp. CHAB 5715]MCC5620534.1 hypothetical protein [Nostoc sp. CHAB 5715]
MEREIKDSDGITWTCIQAFSGLSDISKAEDAAEVEGEPDTYWVVCTPSGGAQSVRLVNGKKNTLMRRYSRKLERTNNWH